MAIGYKQQTAASVTIPPNGAQYTFIDATDSKLKRKDSTGAVTNLEDNAPSSHVGSNSLSDHPAATASTAGFMIAADKAKLDTVAMNATANSSDAYLLNRNYHTGTQLSSTISDFSTAADSRINFYKGAVSGIAPLDINQKVPLANLPDSIMGGNIDAGNAASVFGGINSIDGGNA